MRLPLSTTTANRRQRWYTRCKGLSLTEVIVSTLLVGLLMTAALSSVGASVRTGSQTIASSQAMVLARELLDEVVRLPYEDPDQTPRFGWEEGENDGRRGRSSADDIDDLHGWNETPIQDRDGNDIDGFEGWSRSVKITELTSLPSAQTSGSPIPMSLHAAGSSELRQITVTVVRPDGVSVALSAIRGKSGGYSQSQGLPQEQVTWVGVTLTPVGGEPVRAGTALINHASDQ